MKFFSLKTFLMALLGMAGLTSLQAQFDDVYYDPDRPDVATSDTYYNPTTSPAVDQNGVTYYDDDTYNFDDEYDYYYSSRLRRFHQHYNGFDFYDPLYTSYYYYDPFYSDAYYYPGSTIYINFGSCHYSDYWRWRSWNRWNNWNNYFGWNNWGWSPYNNYYSYNGWCGNNNHYWDGYYGYYNYSNYYNNYDYGCPFPIGNYNGILHTTVQYVNDGGTRGTYYGPRITGNTGSSPRGPGVPPGTVQPVFADEHNAAASNDKPVELPRNEKPGIITPGKPSGQGVDGNPASIPSTREDAGVTTTKPIPVDKELNRDTYTPTSKRPIFKPDQPAYKPYPTDKPSTPSGRQTSPTEERPIYKPYTPDRPSKPATTEPAPRNDTERPSFTPTRDDDKPTYHPSGRSKNEDRPSYTPPPVPRNRNEGNNDDRPSYTPKERNNDAPRGNDRPSYSPPSRDNSSSRSSSSPSRESSSSGSNRSSSSSSSSGHSSGSSPRGRG